MHIDIVPNRNSPPAVLLRESYRDGTKVKKRTLANLSSLSPSQIEAMRAVLRGEELRPISQAFEVVQSRSHGAVQAVSVAMERLGIASLISSKPCRERDLVLAMIAARILAPHTKLAMTRWWHTSTLAETFDVARYDEQAVYDAMDWLLDRQSKVEKKLARRHLESGSLVLYDVSSSYFEGSTCPLAKLGYNRDGKAGKLQVNYGLLTDARGCPVAISVHEGNTADSDTLLPEVKRLREDFGIERVVLIGDRGMVSQKAIDELSESEGIGWITALKSTSIRSLLEQGCIQFGLFDERNLVELTHPDYPGERLVACRNPELAKMRAHKREELLAATEASLDKVRARVEAGRLAGQANIGVAVGRVINQYKVAKHFELDIQQRSFSFRRNVENIAAEIALDGIYVIRTSLPETTLDAADCVRKYKSLANVERAFRSIKTVDLKIRPIHHRLEERVRAHIFLCMLAYYVEWYMRECWRELMFADTEQELKETRDPVAPARRSDAAETKAQNHVLDDGTPAHSFATLMAELSTLVRNTCRTPNATEDAPTFELLTKPNPLQTRALALLDQISA